MQCLTLLIFFLNIDREDTCFISKGIFSQILGPQKGNRFTYIKDTTEMWNYEMRCLTKILMAAFS